MAQGRHEEMKKQRPAESPFLVDAVTISPRKVYRHKHLHNEQHTLNISPTLSNPSTVESLVSHQNIHGVSALQMMLNAKKCHKKGHFEAVFRSAQKLRSIEEDMPAAYLGTIPAEQIPMGGDA